MGCPCETRTSTCRSFATISSGLYRFLAITVLLDVKDIPQVGPLQWGRINKSRSAALGFRQNQRASARTVQDCRPFYLPGGLYALRALTACFRTWKISSWVNRRVSFTFWRTSAATTTPEIAAAAS